MFNMKDTPVATGHTLVTLGLVALALCKPATKWLPLALSGAAVTAGTVLMLGTRPGMWPSLVASLVVFGIIVLRTGPDRTKTHIAWLLGTVSATLLASYAALLAIYPRVFSTPMTTLKVSAFGSADYTCRHSCPPHSRDYLPGHLLSDLPLGLGALMAVGTVVAVILLVVQRRRSTVLDCLALVGSQAFALMAAAIILDSNVYHGLRQVLFAIPALAVLAAVGLAALLTKSPTGAPRRVVAVAAAVALVLPTAVQFALFPYQYTYINVAAEQLGTIGAKVDNDYWRTSFREYVRTGPHDVKIICPFLRTGGVPRRKATDCRTRGAYTLSAFWRGRAAPDQPRTNEFYAIMHGHRPDPPNCRSYRHVERWQNLKRTVISQMFKCHPPTRAEVIEGRRQVARIRAKLGIPPKKYKKQFSLEEPALPSESP
jgi:hypothetical protein